MPRGRAKSDVAEPEQPAQIQPGESVDIRFGRLESGEWYAQIGAVDDENAIAQTSAFAFDALRGLVKQVKQLDGALGSFRLLGEQECGRCEHATPDGRTCCVLECPTGGAEAVAAALQQFHAQIGGLPQASTNEIVRLYGLLKEPVLRGKGEEGHVLTATFEVTGDDLTPEFRYLTPSAKKQVAAFVYHAYAPAKSTDVPLGQRAIDFEAEAGGNGKTEAVEVLMCPVCEKEVHAEGMEPGMPCPLCENGLLEIRARNTAEPVAEEKPEGDSLFCDTCGAVLKPCSENAMSAVGDACRVPDCPGHLVWGLPGKPEGGAEQTETGEERGGGLMSSVIDLEIIEVEGQPWFQFRWEGGDWHGALDALKAAVPPEARSYDKETKLWAVAEAFESELCEIFGNFDSSLDTIRSQIGMGF